MSDAADRSMNDQRFGSGIEQWTETFVFRGLRALRDMKKKAKYLHQCQETTRIDFIKVFIIQALQLLENSVS